MATFLDYLSRGPRQQGGFGSGPTGTMPEPEPPPWPYPVTSEATAGANPYTEIQPLGVAPYEPPTGAEFPYGGPPGTLPALGAPTGLGLYYPRSNYVDPNTPLNAPLLSSYRQIGQMYVPEWVHQLPGPIRDLFYEQAGRAQESQMGPPRGVGPYY